MMKIFGRPNIPVVSISGIIDDKMTLNVDRQLKKIQKSHAKALAVVINSPGGSPVQSDIICQRLKSFTKDHHIPLYTFADDIAASGGYFILCIGDKVYADKTSLIGSVGAVQAWFGMKKLVEDKKMQVRRFTTQDMLLTHIMDSFHELEQNHKDYLLKLTTQVHDLFIDHVEKNRKTQLKLPKEERQNTIYNADVFLGDKAKEYGLVDEIGNYQQVLFQDFPDVKLDFVSRKSWIEIMSGNQIHLNISVSNIDQSNMNLNKELSNKLTAQYLKSFQ